MHPNFSQLTPRWFKRAFVYTGNIDDFRYRFEMDKDNGLLHKREFSVQNGRKRRPFFENRRTEHKKSGEYGNRTSAVCPNSVQSETARGLTARGE